VASPEIVTLVPVPVEVNPPVYRVRVQVPDEGKPIRTTSPVDNEQVGAVITPTEGAAGVAGWSSIVTSADDGEMHPVELVTVKVYVVPAGRGVIVTVLPVPVLVIPPGVRVTAQVPVEGSPLKTTLPVDIAHVGCVIVPVTGAVGVAGCAFITTLADGTEVHPAALVTVKEYVSAGRPETDVLVPVPFVITASGLRVNVHVPVEGNPFSITLPVATVHVGWMNVPAVGAAGMALTVKIYVAVAAVQGAPAGLLVVTVIVTVLPASPAAGV
jgi:hypothetical protein